MGIFSRFTSSIWLSIALVLLGISGIQSWRLRGTELEFSKFKERVATEAKDRTEKKEEFAELSRNSERSFQIQTQGASDVLTTSKINTERALRRDLDDVRSMLQSAEARYASYRAIAESGANSCRNLADRAEAIDRLASEGVGLVAEGKSVVSVRDAEVAALYQYIVELRKLLSVGQNHD